MDLGALNLYGVLILLALVGEFVLQVVASKLNLSTLDDPLPEEFEGIHDLDSYRSSQEYTRVSTRFGLFKASFDLLLVLAFWWGGGFAWLDSFWRGFGLSEAFTGLLFIGSLIVGHGILSLPFSLYNTFGIEEHFGFNRTTPRTFVVDLLKGLALAVVLGGPILWTLLYFFAQAGDRAWIYAWLAMTVFTLVAQVVVPGWILPLFNKFEPLEKGELRQALESYASRVGFPMQEVYVIDGSRRSSRANAFFTGIGKHKRVALFDTLIEQHSVSELVAILAHEIGHFKKRHILQSLLLGIAHNGVVFFLLSIFLGHSGLFEAFGVEHVSAYAGLVFFGLLYAPIELLLGIGLNAWSRKHEFEADRFAVETVAEPRALWTALRDLAKENLSHLTPHPFHSFLSYSHPPVVERLRAIDRAIMSEKG